MPHALQDAVGWPNRDCTAWYADYARLMFDTLGDRVALWATHNEPWVVAFLGHALAEMAPGIADYSQAFQTAHHLLLAHGQAVQIFRQGGYEGEIGIVLNLSHFVPASESEADHAACRRSIDSMNSLFLDEDKAQIQQPLDFLGINYYTT